MIRSKLPMIIKLAVPFLLAGQLAVAQTDRPHWNIIFRRRAGMKLKAARRWSVMMFQQWLKQLLHK